ncbi:MAG: phytanoyl-CoA dioxygenase family protein [Caldilineaceae bacterium]
MPTTDFQLTEQQLTFFNTFGYLGFPGLMADRAADIERAFEAIWAERGGGHNGKPHDGTARSCIVPFIDQSEYLASLLDDPRIHNIATALLGDDFNYMGSDGNYYVGDTRWHSDGWHPKTLHIKIAFYLDPVTRDTGALRVIPGSHRLGDQFADGLQQQIRQSSELWGMEGNQVPAIALESKPGDLVLFNHNTKHAAFGGSKSRRMFTINLCQRYPEERIQELRDYINGAARFWIDRVYGEKMVRTAGPERQRHLEQVMANDGHLAELSRKARETMLEPSRG